MRKFLLFLVLLTGFTALVSNKVNAQGVTTATVNGIVTDSKGAIPGATVVITHLPTGTVYSTTSRVDGRFNLPNLRVGGPYTFKVSFVGYQAFVQDNITLTLGQDQRINATLLDASTQLSEVVVKGTQNKIINNSRTGAQEIITRSQIDRLPSLNRSIYDYTKLAPSANGRSFGGRSDSYNNLTVDGALFNNSFGLASTLGGQANSQPISLDAIEQIQVAVSPFDVTQGRFAGTGINTVVKSGTNEFKGTAYYYKRTTGLTGKNAGSVSNINTPIDYNQRGLSIGGPIIKNKLFFFISGEQERISDPATTFTAAKPGQKAGGSVSAATANQLDSLRNFLKTKYGYDPGPYDNFSLKTYSDKITTKLDWNINDKNTLSVKYFYLKSHKDIAPSNSGAPSNNRQPGATTLPFQSSFYTINNNFNIVIAELNTRISNTMANKLTAGYQALRDYRTSLGGRDFPLVDIQSGSATSPDLTAFGYEPFTAFNILKTNTYQLSDNLTIYKGKHEISLGTSNELNHFTNGFAPQYNGAYVFSSLADFYNSANTGAATANTYQYRYSLSPDGSFPFAKVSATTIGVYAQDKWQATDNFKLTYGIRADLPLYSLNNVSANPNVSALVFRNGVKLDVSKFPKSRIELSPRVGFNWDVYGDASTQLRGGVGLFTGPTPYVWISNQASNNGVLFGSYSLTTVGTSANAPQSDPHFVFNPNANANRPAPGQATENDKAHYNLAVVDNNFRNPKNLRGNVAVDQKLPWGMIGTLEFMYSKDINAVYQQNVALSATGTALVGPDNRIVYSNKTLFPVISDPVTHVGLNTTANPNITDAELMRNTNKGYTYNITAQIQKTVKELNFTAAYTHSDSRTVNDGGSVAQSIWSGRPVSGDPNSDVTSYSNYYAPNRVIASVSYRKAYGKNFATSVGLTYEGINSGVVSNLGTSVASYTYSGDLNNDGVTNNDLIYIPKTQKDIVLVKDNTTDPRTPDQIWAQLNDYINQDPYLKKHRGEYAKRNGLLLPFLNQVNFNFTQDIFVGKGKTKNTLQFEFNVLNVGNLLNKDWGNVQVLNRAQLLSYKGLVKTAGDPDLGKPTFSFPYFLGAPLTKTYSDGANLASGVSPGSRWQAQFGLRYIFN
ncbi:Carboxypeptidase regulatory-like domain-containing protein [Mucilaginibacter pineti]|uniref:Carboxypeptidase regulatory-like domain-containing protein n=1 Tax=Mucilaginibacter pineti TaxID=1391627 RepID=A0A1G7BGM1_9SPHI|nr:carboxypeptidase regulatory-like domain-containing protein [Mucilaginibacter pineti]SDE26174.1 Carboxypeptidase regulatory-like domain-containing protein [Mucilaginibacter pineti]